MGIAVVGISHHTAPVEVRERMVFSQHAGDGALGRMVGSGAAREAVLLSTCNRTEVYLHLPERAGSVAAVEALLADQAGMSLEQTLCHLYTHRGRAAVEHLFRVSSSLDSMILGEAQIQGQVRAAFEHARDLGGSPPVLGPVLGRLFQHALAVGGRVRSETSLGAGAASVASAAVDLARKIFGTLSGRHAVVVGAGEMSELALHCFAAEGLKRISVANRSPERAEELARRVGGHAIPYERAWAELADTDILVTATGAPHRVLTRDRLAEAIPGGPARPLFILDIALPRDVESAVGGMQNVFLYDIDDLQQIVGSSLERRRREVPAAEALIAEEVALYWEWLTALDVVPLVRELRDRAEAVRAEELARALRGLEHLSPEDRATVERLTRQLLNKLIHDPTVRLKEAAANGRGAAIVDAARFLYGLAEGEEARPPEDAGSVDER